MRSLVLVAGLALLFAASPAGAAEELPAGHLYVGLGGGIAQPFGDSLIERKPLGTGTATALYAHYEGTHFLVGVELGGGHFAHDDTYSNPFQLAVRAGPVFGAGAVAPYVAGGVSLLGYGAIFDDAASATGLTGEVGVLLGRSWRWLRVTPYLQVNVPAFPHSSGKGSENVGKLTWAALGLRVEL